VAHGLFGLSIADSLKTQTDFRFVPGMSLGWGWNFVLPIKINDVVQKGERWLMIPLRAA
jgi:hypothetical protein